MNTKKIRQYLNEAKTVTTDTLINKVYEALADIAFETDASKEDMEWACQWFNLKFFEDEEDEEEDL